MIHGMKDAGAAFEGFASEVMSGYGYEVGKYNPSCYGKAGPTGGSAWRHGRSVGSWFRDRMIARRSICPTASSDGRTRRIHPRNASESSQTPDICRSSSFNLGLGVAMPLRLPP